MAKKSKLLEFLLADAEQRRTADALEGRSADYFMLSLLYTVIAKVEGKLPAAISDNETVGEIDQLIGNLETYITEFEKAATDIHEMIRNSNYTDGAIDFDAIQNIAANKADRAKEPMDATLYLDLLLAESTVAVRRHIFGDPSAGAAEEPAETEPRMQQPVPDAATIDEARRRIADLARGGEGASEEEKPELVGMDALADIIERTKTVQRVLLERVYGQDQAVAAFVSGYFQSELTAKTRKGVTRPQATFLFAGPPGVGKTFLAESAADALGLPFRRFDMSEYSDKEANIEFCGSDNVYKNAKEGNVTGFVAKHPKCVLLFDEIEKAHINVIYLFLQLLDAGRLRDNFTDEEVSFTDAIIIFTTNAGQNLYNDPDISNLSVIPRKKILKALATDTNPATGQPLFPAAICSRFASGNVVMLNHLTAHNLLAIAEKEICRSASAIEESMGIRIETDPLVSSAILLGEGGSADARTVKGRAASFFHEELYELLRLIASDKNPSNVTDLEDVKVTLNLPEGNAEILTLFVNPSPSEILVFADEDVVEECRSLLPGLTVHGATDAEEAKDVLFNRDITLILCDMNCGLAEGNADGALLNLEDIGSRARDFFLNAANVYDYPIYILEREENEISQEEFLSFSRDGAHGKFAMHAEGNSFYERVRSACDSAYCQSTMHRLAGAKKVLAYSTAQTVSADGKHATVELFDFRLSLATDMGDSKGMIDAVARPKTRFADVIGAEDAKKELAYFVDYLRNPSAYMRRGMRAPKGILLYGPPGTGKTMLARAMAGESNVTFIAAEGNQFLKRYVGEGPQAVHELFATARKYAPSILFIDEIDAIAKDRNISSGGGSDTADVLTAFLTEMDGFNTDTAKPVFVLAATNYEVEQGRGKSLDAAILRRFDRKVMIDLPDKEGRARYIRLKMSKNKHLELSDEQIDNIALRSTGMSLAELESVIELAMRNAIRAHDGRVNDAIFDEAFESFNSGSEKKWDERRLLRTARHEAGHALIYWLGGETPSYMTIVSRGDYGGYMQHGDTEKKFGYTKRELLNRICTSMGGRAAELVCYGEEEGMSTGPSGDLQNATHTAERIICTYGMDEKLGMASISREEIASSAYGATVRARINEILEEQLALAIELVQKNRVALDKLVDLLMEKNHVKGDEIDDVLSKYVFTPRATPSV